MEKNAYLGGAKECAEMRKRLMKGGNGYGREDDQRAGEEIKRKL